MEQKPTRGHIGSGWKFTPTPADENLDPRSHPSGYRRVTGPPQTRTGVTVWRWRGRGRLAARDATRLDPKCASGTTSVGWRWLAMAWSRHSRQRSRAQRARLAVARLRPEVANVGAGSAVGGGTTVARGETRARHCAWWVGPMTSCLVLGGRTTGEWQRVIVRWGWQRPDSRGKGWQL